MKQEFPPSNILSDAYPLLCKSGLEALGRLAPSVPVVPDRTYDIFRDEDGGSYVLVKTDHPDPLHDSEELLALSEKYRFDEVIAPGGEDTLIPVRASDEMVEDFFVRDGATYYYLAPLSAK